MNSATIVNFTAFSLSLFKRMIRDFGNGLVRYSLWPWAQNSPKYH